MPRYSIIAPAYNEQDALPPFYARLVSVMHTLAETYEVIFVNDGSTDRTAEVLKELSAADSRVRVIHLSRNFGHQIAITAGLDFADGDAVIIIDADLQDPPEVIPRLVDAWHQGNDVVFAMRERRIGETRFKLVSAKLFYRMLARITAVNIPRDTGDFRLLDHKAVLALRRLREQHRFMRGLSAWIGYRQAGVLYERQERHAGATKYPLRKMLSLAMDATASFSYLPLQLATTIGFAIAGLSVFGIILTFILRLLDRAVAGQATTLVAVLFLGGIQMIFLGVIGEYLGRIYDEVKQRPLYLIGELWGFADGSSEPAADAQHQHNAITSV